MCTVVMPKARPLFFMHRRRKNNQPHFSCREKWSVWEDKPHLVLLPACTSPSGRRSFFFFCGCPSIYVSHLFSRLVERKVSSKVEPTLSQTLIIEEGRRGGEWLLQYSYVILTWLPATRPCTQYLWSLTDDWGCNAVSSLRCLLLLSLFFPLYIFLIFHPYATSSFLCSLPPSAISGPVFFPLPRLFIPFSSAAISQKSMACPWAKFNYRPN